MAANVVAPWPGGTSDGAYVSGSQSSPPSLVAPNTRRPTRWWGARPLKNPAIPRRASSHFETPSIVSRMRLERSTSRCRSTGKPARHSTLSERQAAVSTARRSSSPTSMPGHPSPSTPLELVMSWDPPAALVPASPPPTPLAPPLSDPCPMIAIDLPPQAASDSANNPTRSLERGSVVTARDTLYRFFSRKTFDRPKSWMHTGLCRLPPTSMHHTFL